MPRGRRKKIFGRGAEFKGTTGIVIEDEVTTFTKMASINFPSEVDRAVRHVASVVWDVAVEYMKQGKHGQPLTELQSQRMVDRQKNKGQTLRAKKFAGDINSRGRGLAKAIRWEHKKGKQLAVVGWASNDARKRSGKAFQEGLINTKNGTERHAEVNKKMKMMFAILAKKARGKVKRKLMSMAALPEGYKIKNPKRPIFDPVYRSMKGKIPKLLEKRILKNMGLVTKDIYNAVLLSETGIDQNARDAEREARAMKNKRRRGRRAS